MSKTLVVFYSRSGSSKTCATVLADKLGASLEEIVDPTRRNGFFGFMKSGYQATAKKTVTIGPSAHDPKDFEDVIIVTPVWASNTPPATRAWLNRHEFALVGKKVHVLTLSGGEDVTKFRASFSEEFGQPATWGSCFKGSDIEKRASDYASRIADRSKG